MDENFKEIEDIIDARKRLGQYNIYKHINPLNIRGVHSHFQTPLIEEETHHHHHHHRTVKFDEASLISQERESEINNIKHTDSEITIVRVNKCTSSACGTTTPKRKLNKWEMMLNDIAIPGDGTHLGESPSLVNLATFLSENFQCEGDDEYLVPLSSWDPLIINKFDDLQNDTRLTLSDSKLIETYSIKTSNTDPNLPSRLENSISDISIIDLMEDFNLKRSTNNNNNNNWTTKFSKFWRKHCRKTNNVDDEENHNNPS